MSERMHPIGRYVGGSYEWPCPVCDCLLQSRKPPTLDDAKCGGCRALVGTEDLAKAVASLIRERNDADARARRWEKLLGQAEDRINELQDMLDAQARAREVA